MSRISHKEIKKTKIGILKDLRGSKNLLITFGGIKQGIGIPVFEFFNSVSIIDCDKVFIRDFNQAWYQKGIDNDINTLEKTTHYIEKLLLTQQYNKVCFLGNSMGGYAAILFGLKFNIDKVISFAPQTFINRFNRMLYLDFRWRKQISNIYKQKKKGIYDLKTIFELYKNSTTKVKIIYSIKHRLDKIHAERLKKYNQVHLVPMAKGGHAIVKSIRDNDGLLKLIKSSFEV